MIAAAVLAYIGAHPERAAVPQVVRWYEHHADDGTFVVEYMLPAGAIVPVRFAAGEHPRYQVAMVTEGARLAVATRIDAPCSVSDA